MAVAERRVRPRRINILKVISVVDLPIYERAVAGLSSVIVNVEYRAGESYATYAGGTRYVNYVAEGVVALGIHAEGTEIDVFWTRVNSEILKRRCSSQV